MIDHVGIKIKKLRKELKLTQSELAGDEMTKSMLSQIENNISRPSMKSLEYLAKRLNKPAAYFLENDEGNAVISNEGLSFSKNIADECQLLNNLLELQQVQQVYQRLVEIREKHPEALKNKTYLDVVFKLGAVCIETKEYNIGEDCLKTAIEGYSENGMYVEAAKGYVELGRKQYEAMNFESCLDICDKAFDVYNKAINKDVSFEIELFHYRILMLTVMGDVETLIKDTKKAIALSEKSDKYYKTDELYRLLSAFNYLKGDYDEYHYNINKASQFASFTDNKICLAGIYFLFSIEAIDKGKYEEALKHLEKYREYHEGTIYLYYMNRAKAYYHMGDFKSAYENIKLVDYPERIKIKLDYLMLWASKVYEGLILNKLGHYEEGICAITEGIEKMSHFELSKHLVWAYKSLSEVYSEHNDFENAFLALKKSDELNEKITKNKNIFY